MSGVTPVVEKLVDNSIILKHHIVDVPVSLTVQRDCRWLALWADAFGPRWMFPTASFYLALDIFERDVLSAIHSRRLFSQIRVERKMFDLLLLEIAFVVRFNWRAVNASTVVRVTAKLLIFLSLNATVMFEQFNVNSVFDQGRRLFLSSNRRLWVAAWRAAGFRLCLKREEFLVTIHWIHLMDSQRIQPFACNK